MREREKESTQLHSKCSMMFCLQRSAGLHKACSPLLAGIWTKWKAGHYNRSTTQPSGLIIPPPNYSLLIVQISN